MLVCAHGDVFDFCDRHGMTVFETYDGAIEDYNGSCRVLVTGQKLEKTNIIT